MLNNELKYMNYRRYQSFWSVVASIVMCLALPSCWKSNAPDDTAPQGVVVINVLDKSLYDDAHIKGSINVTLENLDAHAKKLDKNADIIVYCSNYMCSTSDYAAKKLRDAGFEHVWVYAGGTAEWYQAGLPIIGPAKSSYLNKTVKRPESAGHGEVPVITMDELARKLHVSR